MHGGYEPGRVRSSREFWARSAAARGGARGAEEGGGVD